MNIAESTQLELFKPLRLVSYRFNFTFVDLFSGIGGFRIPLEELGGKCLGYSEIDKEAIKIYRQNFISYLNQDEIELGDITKIDSLPNNTNLVVGGVPCQPWSVAGKLKGFDDPRGKLWFDVLRLLNKNKPKAFIFENVRGLASPANRQSFEYLLHQFESIDYCVKWKVINSYDFGVPQSRERVFIVGIRNDLENCQEYQFPDSLKTQPKLLDVIDELQNCQPIQKVKLDPKILFGGQIPPSRNRFQKDDELNDFFTFSDLRNGHTTIHSWDLIKTTKKEQLICLTILRERRKKKYGIKDGNPLSFDDLREIITNLDQSELEELVIKNILRKTDNNKYEFVNSKNLSGINGIYRIFLPNSEMIPTLTATGARDFIATISITADNPEDYKRIFLKKIYRPRKYKPITAKDCCRLQGFPDWFVFHDNENIAKKQFGNAVSVPAVYYIAKELLNFDFYLKRTMV
jgi:DNA (cytosine-5)-methyltransferase 1